MSRATKRISNNRKRKVRQLLAAASQAVSNGRDDVCLGLCREIERLWPECPEFLNLRGIMAARAGKAGEAEAWFRKAIEAAPRSYEYQKNLATLYANSKMAEKAVQSYRSALRLNPGSLEAALGLARGLMDLRQYEEAREALTDAQRKHAGNHDVLLGLAATSLHLHDEKSARRWLDEALRRFPDSVPALIQNANLLQSEGDLEASERMLRRVLELEPEHVGAAVLLSNLRRFKDAEDEDFLLLRRLYEQASEGSEDYARLCFAMGKSLERIGDYDAAFACFSKGNEARRREVSYDADAELAHLEEVMRHYAPEVLRRTSGISDETPVFIVGMPRCGSTLVEQVLASHPDVAARGEWQGFEKALAEMQSADAPLTLEQITAFNTEQWREVGERFLTRLKDGFPDAGRITDKTLINTRLIGAIHCALPHARIVHVRRHPLDACWSLFKASLEGWEHGYIYSMGEIGYRYRAYLRLMAHWRQVLPEGVMLDLDYESLVADQEGQTRSLLEFCGLPWDERCLQFQKADTAVWTSSITQVRQSLYRDAVERWRHYEKHMEPLKRILERELADWPG